MSTHTPGPWIVNAEQVFGTGHKIAAVNDASPNWQEDRDLIAAAPDLLAALKEMVTWMPSGFAPQSKSLAMKMAYDAIAKAEGTS